MLGFLTKLESKGLESRGLESVELDSSDFDFRALASSGLDSICVWCEIEHLLSVKFLRMEIVESPAPLFFIVSFLVKKWQILDFTRNCVAFI